MRKFNDISKDKQAQFQKLEEGKILRDFKKVYATLLDVYQINEFNNLQENEQTAFLTELNNYWSEAEGISQKGKRFIETKSINLTENSTPLQKKNFLKTRVKKSLNETLIGTNFKDKIYTIIDEMYREINGSSISDVLNPNTIRNILMESCNEIIENYMDNIHHELSESAKAKSRKVKLYIKK